MDLESLVSRRAALLLSVGFGGCASPTRGEPGPSAEQVKPDEHRREAFAIVVQPVLHALLAAA